ncbi:MAG: endonuclease/exonuclease/phosphatase family protein [Planctomycetota bacterium]
MQPNSPPHDPPAARHRPLLHRAVACLLLAATSLTLASLPARSWWLADVLANLRVQACIASIMLLTPLALLKLKIPSLLAAVLLAWHASFLLPAVVPDRPALSPATLQHSPSHPHPPHISVCLANVRFNNPQHHIIARSLQQSAADVLVVVELNPALRQSLTTQLTPDYPHTVWADREPGAFGIGLLSRLPLQNPHINHFGATAQSSSIPRVPAISVDVRTPAGPVRLIAVHCIPPIGQHNFQVRSRQLADAAIAAKKTAANNPVLLVGDLNLTPWAPAFHDFLQHARLINPASGSGVEPTWNAGPRYPCGLLIDHILHSPQLTCLNRQIPPSINSDHRPVLALFRISNPDPLHGSAMPSASRPYSPDPPPDTIP